MPKLKFTIDALTKVPYTDGITRTSYQDTQNSYLQLRVSKNIKAFYYYRKIKGKPLRIKLGEFPKMNPQEARTECDIKTNEIFGGKLKNLIKITFAELFNQYIKRHALQHRKSFEKAG